MQISVQVDTYGLENKLHLLAKEARVAPGLVIKEETRLLTQNIIRLTPPASNAQGRAAVMGDMRRVVTELDAENIKWDPLKRAVQKRDERLIATLLQRKKNKQRLAGSFEIQQQHERLRTKYGRINRGTKPQLAALPRVFNAYLRQVQSRVGWARGAWVSALIAAGGRAPSWYARHADRSGYAIANFGENPFVSAIARNVKIPGYQRFVDNAVKNRERTTQKKIDALVAGRAVNLGFVTIPAR